MVTLGFLIACGAGFVITFWGILIYTMNGTRPHTIFAVAIRNMLTDWRVGKPATVLLLIMFSDFVESAFDDRITRWLGWDFTPLIHGIEGDLAAVFQVHQSLLVTCYFTFMYVFAFASMLGAAIAIYAYSKKHNLFRLLGLGYLLNFTVALPFYLFFPVKGTWLGNPLAVRPRLDEVSPLIMVYYRILSADDNCFPSLHTSLALTLMFVSLKGDNKRFAVLNVIAALSVMYSTLYLGIHWVSDVAAGVVLAMLVCAVLHFKWRQWEKA